LHGTSFLCRDVEHRLVAARRKSQGGALGLAESGG
jgi:hypothetical protein